MLLRKHDNLQLINRKYYEHKKVHIVIKDIEHDIEEKFLSQNQFFKKMLVIICPDIVA